MNLALNNATNVIEYYRAKNEDVDVEIVTYGPGLHMLRDDTSAVQDRLKRLSAEMPRQRGSAVGHGGRQLRPGAGRVTPPLCRSACCRHCDRLGLHGVELPTQHFSTHKTGARRTDRCPSGADAAHSHAGRR